MRVIASWGGHVRVMSSWRRHIGIVGIGCVWAMVRRCLAVVLELAQLLDGCGLFAHDSLAAQAAYASASGSTKHVWGH